MDKVELSDEKTLLYPQQVLTVSLSPDIPKTFIQYEFSVFSRVKLGGQDLVVPPPQGRLSRRQVSKALCLHLLNSRIWKLVSVSPQDRICRAKLPRIESKSTGWGMVSAQTLRGEFGWVGVMSGWG